MRAVLIILLLCLYMAGVFASGNSYSWVRPLVPLNWSNVSYAANSSCLWEDTGSYLTPKGGVSSGLNIDGSSLFESDIVFDGGGAGIGPYINDDEAIYFGTGGTYYIWYDSSDLRMELVLGDVWFSGSPIIRDTKRIYIGEDLNSGIIQLSGGRFSLGGGGGGTGMGIPVTLSGGLITLSSLQHGTPSSGILTVKGSNGANAGTFGTNLRGGNANYTLLHGGYGGKPKGTGAWGNSYGVVVGNESSRFVCAKMNSAEDLCVVGDSEVRGNLTVGTSAKAQNLTMWNTGGTLYSCGPDSTGTWGCK